MKKKHIAVLSTMYYPDMGAPSACIDKYVNSLNKEYIFHIITKTEIANFEPSRDYDVRYITSFRHRLINNCHSRIAKGENMLWNRMILAVVNFCKLIQTQYSFPSAQKWEVNAYYRELEKLNNEVSLDSIITVSNTWTAQLATLEFNKKYPRVRWIAFILDPYFSFHIYYKYKLFKHFWKNLNKIKEQEIFDKANYCMLSSEMYKNVPLLFHVNKDRFYEIKFTLNRLAPSIVNKHNAHQEEKCKLIFAGMFYKIIRNPEFTLSTLSKVRHIQFDMFVGKGECEDVLRHYMNKENIHREQFVNRERYINMICSEYDILVNVGNVSTLQAPSKMLELLSSGKPILNFYFTKDSQYKKKKKYPLGLNIGYQEEGAVEKVEEFCREVKGKSISYEEVENLFPENKLEIQVELLRRLIES